MFVCLTFIHFFRYNDTLKTPSLVYGGISFLAALLSKEYALTLLLLLPMGLYILRRDLQGKQIAGIFVMMGSALILYLIMRFSATGLASAPVDPSRQDPLNDPYMHAPPGHKFTSIIDRLDDYLKLLFYPDPLVSDYSYQHFAYTDITDWTVSLSFIINGGLVAAAVVLFFRRHVLGFALLFYFAFFMLVNNVVMEVGATMGERLIYHSSLGFCMAIAWLIITGIEKFDMPGKFIVPALAVALTIPCFKICFDRNAEWYDDYSLFTSDVKKHPNSALTNGNAGARYMDHGLQFLGKDSITPAGDTLRAFGRDTVKMLAYADTAIFYLQRSVTLHEKYVNGYLNLGLCYYYKNMPDKAAEAWGSAYQYFPSNQILLSYQQMLVSRGNAYAAIKDYANAARFMRYAVMTNPSDPKVLTMHNRRFMPPCQLFKIESAF
jgi:protein O-mannosyl-transferase